MYLKVAHRYTDVELAFFGGSFTAIDKNLQEKYLSCVSPFIGNGIDSIRISTRPDCIDDDILSMLKKYNVSVIELGAQSMDDKVLKLSGRGHMASDTVNSSALIKKHGIVLGLQTMPGLPGADRNSDIETAKKIADLEPSLVRIYPTITIKDTYLEVMYNRGEYIPAPIDYMVDLCAEIVGIYEQRNIDVARIGLQSSENMTEEKTIIAGPYHPAFGQLVFSRIGLKKIEAKMTEDNIYDATVEIKVPSGELSTYIGQKKCNVKELKDKFDLKSIKFTEDEHIREDFIIQAIK